MDSPEISTSSKKPACPTLSSVNRMGHCFSKDLLARENIAPLNLQKDFCWLESVLESKIYHKTDTAE